MNFSWDRRQYESETVQSGVNRGEPEQDWAKKTGENKGQEDSFRVKGLGWFHEKWKEVRRLI